MFVNEVLHVVSEWIIGGCIVCSYATFSTCFLFGFFYCFVDLLVIYLLALTVETLKMQASTYAGRADSGFGLQTRRRGFERSKNFNSRRILACSNLRMTERSSCFGLKLGSASMGIELGRPRARVPSVFGESAKPRSIRASASGL